MRVVLVTLDTLRHGSLAGSAEHPGRMPRTRRFAKRALVFDRHYASTSSTQPTHAGLLTGLHPWQHGVTRNGLVLADEFTTVAEVFKRNGFVTGAVVASFSLEARFGFDQGFDRFVGDFRLGDVPIWNEQEVAGGRFYTLAEEITRRALEMLDGTRGTRHASRPASSWSPTMARASARTVRWGMGSV